MNERVHTPGIWYEEERGRYRVRVYKGTAVFHLSYHEDFDSAHSSWLDAHRAKNNAPEEAVLHDTESQLNHLLGVLHDKSDNPLDGLLTLEQFSAIYFVQPPSKFTVWRWVRLGHIPAVRIGRRYFVTPYDAEQFIKRGTNG